MILGSIEFIRVNPIQVQSPCPISKVVANVVNITSVNEGMDSTIQQISNIGTEILHPVSVEFHVDSHVTGSPVVRFFRNVKSFFCLGVIEPGFNIGEVIAHRNLLTLFAHIVWVHSSHLIGSCLSSVAQNEGSLTSKLVDERIACITLFNEGDTLWNIILHSLVDFIRNSLDPVRIVNSHFRVPLVLFTRVCETVTDCETRKVDLQH
mmetsp:Transcript_11695/g.17531  ORF Transcript_11695/g.17531 Transcript_11695/m.17531 type:complete len:207 (-) Transcript_11695:800-1420(-)